MEVKRQLKHQSTRLPGRQTDSGLERNGTMNREVLVPLDEVNRQMSSSMRAEIEFYSVAAAPVCLPPTEQAVSLVHIALSWQDEEGGLGVGARPAS